MIDAVLLDLDDTLYPQSAWLDGAWSAVAARAASLGVQAAAFEPALRAFAQEGTDRGRIIDRALEYCGFPECPLAPLVDAFRAHAPSSLPMYPGARAALERVQSIVPIGIVTDGDPRVQRAKLRALDLRVPVICSDDFGRQFRKPHPLPFERAAARLLARPDACVFVGDRPEKDIAGPQAIGMRAIRVLTGEYAATNDVVKPWRTCATVVEALDGLCADLRAPARL